MDSEGIDILAIQETWEGQYVIPNLQGYKWYGRAREDKRGGVGFYVYASLGNSIQIFRKTSLADSIWVKVKGEGNTTAMCIGCVYMPDSSKPAAQRKAAFESLQTDLEFFKRKGEVVLCGDFNARVGKGNSIHEHVGMFGEAVDVKDSGKLLKSFLGVNAMYTLNGRNPTETPEYTWEEQSNRGRATVIDYIVVEAGTLFGTARPSFAVRSDLDGAISSDHKLLLAELPRRAKRTRVKAAQCKKVFNVDRFHDPEHGERDIGLYMQCLRRRLPEFEAFVEEAYNQQNTWGAHKAVREKFHALVEAAAEEAIGSKKVVPGISKSWWTAEITDAIKARRQVHAEWRSQGGTEAWQAYEEAREKVHKMVKDARSLFTKSADETICEAFDECQSERKTRMGDKRLWQAFNSAYRPKNAQASAPSLLKKQNGSYACGDKPIADAFGEHYKQLGNSATFNADADFDSAFQQEVQAAVAHYINASAEPEGSGDENLDADLTSSEVARAKPSLKSGKAGSPLENTSAELLKYGGEPMTAMLLCMYNKAWEHECTFQRPGVIVSLFKKGDKEDGNNYRGITLLSVVDKVYTKIINNRVTNFAEAKGLLHESQNGYRPGRGCIDHVWTLHAVTSGRMRAGLRTYALFVDVVKAFPSVWRDGLWYKLWEMGIRGKMFRVLVHLYDSLSRCALHNGESSEYFSSDLGLAEGDPLSPLLYTLFINGLLKEIWEKHPGIPLPKEVDNSGSGEQGIGRAESNIEGRSKLVALMLADDLVGLAESQEELQKMADTIHAYSRKWRFKLSPTKSAVVVFGPLPPNKESPKVSFSSENLPVLDAYTYLGIVFTSGCKWEAHIAGMIEKATASINALQTFFQNRHVSFEVKRAMLLALIRPRVEYGSEVWWASSQQTNTIESKIQIEVLKRSLHCKPNICHEVLKAEAGVRPLSSWLDQRKVEWWFKLQQKDTTSLSRQALEASWPSHRNYASWQKRFNKLRAELGMQEETLQARVREGHLPSFRAYVRWSIYERDRAVREEGARNKSTLATYMQHYNDDINYFKPQPYLCRGPLSKGMELIMQLRAGILPLNAMTAKFGRQSASRQSARRECCKSCDLGPELGGEVESPEHFLFDCPIYQAQRQKLWEKLTSDPDVAAKCQILDGKSDEEKLHSMLNEEFWGVDVDEESGLVYGPFKHAFKCIAKYVAAAWKIRNAYAHPSDVA